VVFQLSGRITFRLWTGLLMAAWRCVYMSFFFFFCFSIYTPQQLPNTRARRGLIKIKGLGTCTERMVRQGRRAGEVSRRLHLAPGRVERVINSESEICRFGTGCSGSVSWGFVGRRVRLGVVGSFEGRGVLEEEDEGVCTCRSCHSKRAI